MEEPHEITPDPSITRVLKSLYVSLVFYNHTHSVTVTSFIVTLKIIL